MIRSIVRFCVFCFCIMLSLALPLEAKAAETCLLDGRGSKASDVTNCTVGGGMCGSSISVNNAKGLQLNTGTAQTPVDVHGVCRYIDNTSSESYFVPLKSSEEWGAFLAHPPSGVSLSKCAKPFSGQNASRGLLFGPSSARPDMGDTDGGSSGSIAETTVDISFPYWRAGETWPSSGASCSGAKHTFSHSCYEEVPTSHCWKWVPRTCTGSRCTDRNDKGVCILIEAYTYDCTYCADRGSICKKNWTNWSETFSFLGTALDSDTYSPSWQGQSTRTSGSTRPNSQCTTRCTYDGHDCTGCAGTLACLPNGSVTCKNEVLYDSCGAKVGTCEEACVPTGTTSCKDNVEYDSCGTELGSCLSCKPDTETQTVACPAGQTGTHTQKRDYTCATVLIGEGWGDWYDVTNTCKAPTCVATSETKTVSCPSGQTGTHTQKRDYTCPAAAWTAWYDVTNTCKAACTPASKTQYVACPSGQTGVNWQRSDYTCPAAKWSSWYDVTNTCKTTTPTCTPTSDMKILSCPSGQTGTHKQQRDYTCPEAKWSSWYDVKNTCKATTPTCTPASQTKTVSCPTGQTGTHKQQRDYTCPAAKWSSWYDVTNTCKASCTPKWKTTTSCNSGAREEIESDGCGNTRVKKKCPQVIGGGSCKPFADPIYGGYGCGCEYKDKCYKTTWSFWGVGRSGQLGTRSPCSKGKVVSGSYSFECHAY